MGDFDSKGYRLMVFFVGNQMNASMVLEAILKVESNMMSEISRNMSTFLKVPGYSFLIV